MSRPIKFRAWDGEKMLFGPDFVENLMIHTTGRNSFSFSYHRDDSVTFMQYTGLKDKNGVEIYEGDIVRLKFRDGIERYSYELGIIKWHESSAAFKWFAVEEDPSDGNNYWLTHADSDWREVIGNIYENPELLEAKS